MARAIKPRFRAGNIYLRFRLHGIDFYKQWGLESNPEHLARMEYIAKLINQDIASGSFTDLEKYFTDAELWDWQKVYKAIKKKPQNSTNLSLLRKLEQAKPRLNGPQHVRAWLDSMSIATATKARYLGAIKSVAPLICQGVSYSQKNMSQPNPFSQKEIDSIKQWLLLESRETETLIYLWLHCGFRPGEARALRVDDVDTVSMKVSIKRSMQNDGTIKSTKTGTVRSIEVPLEIMNKVKELMLDRGHDDFLFPSIRHHSNWSGRVWRKLLVKAGVTEDFRPYRLRHTAITAAVQRNPQRIALIAKEYGTSPEVIFNHYLGYINPDS